MRQWLEEKKHIAIQKTELTNRRGRADGLVLALDPMTNTAILIDLCDTPLTVHRSRLTGWPEVAMPHGSYPDRRSQVEDRSRSRLAGQPEVALSHASRPGQRLQAEDKMRLWRREKRLNWRGESWEGREVEGENQGISVMHYDQGRYLGLPIPVRPSPFLYKILAHCYTNQMIHGPVVKFQQFFVQRRVVRSLGQFVTKFLYSHTTAQA